MVEEWQKKRAPKPEDRHRDGPPPEREELGTSSRRTTGAGTKKGAQ
jgi:hypothetical protein